MQASVPFRHLQIPYSSVGFADNAVDTKIQGLRSYGNNQYSDHFRSSVFEANEDAIRNLRTRIEDNIVWAQFGPSFAVTAFSNFEDRVRTAKLLKQINTFREKQFSEK